MSRRTWDLCASSGLLGVATGLIGVWWWALLGMDVEIGLALMTTDMVLIMGACGIIGNPRPKERS